MINHTIYSINKLRNTVIRKKNPENENPNKIIITAEKILNFNNQQNGKGLQI